MSIKKVISYGASFLAAVLLFPAMLMTSIQLTTFDKGFFEQQYEKLNTAEYIGIDEPELLRVTWELLDYIKGARDSLDGITAVIHGETRPVFNEREKDHMVDVRELYGFGYRVRNFSIIGALLLFLIVYFVSGKHPFKYIANSYLTASGVLLLLTGALYLLMQGNFTYYWDQFHYLFFDNDLWLLNPETDIMIQMVPEPFFYSAVTRVIAYFLVMAVTLLGVCMLLRNKSRKKTRQI